MNKAQLARAIKLLPADARGIVVKGVHDSQLFFSSAAKREECWVMALASLRLSMSDGSATPRYCIHLGEDQ